MAAYLIGHITVQNPILWEKYINGVQKSLLPYETNIIFRGKLSKVLTGKHLHHDTVVIKFRDQKTLQDWYSSKEYQDLIPIRDKAADVVILSYND